MLNECLGGVELPLTPFHEDKKDSSLILVVNEDYVGLGDKTLLPHVLNSIAIHIFVYLIG